VPTLTRHRRLEGEFLGKPLVALSIDEAPLVTVVEVVLDDLVVETLLLTSGRCGLVRGIVRDLCTDEVIDEFRSAESWCVLVEDQQAVKVRHASFLLLGRDDVCLDLAEDMTLQKIAKKLLCLVLEDPLDLIRMVDPRVAGSVDECLDFRPLRIAGEGDEAARMLVSFVSDPFAYRSGSPCFSMMVIALA